MLKMFVVFVLQIPSSFAVKSLGILLCKYHFLLFFWKEICIYIYLYGKVVPTT